MILISVGILDNRLSDKVSEKKKLEMDANHTSMKEKQH